MKKLMICCLFLLSCTSVNARTPQSILVYGKAMQQLFILTIVNDTQVEIKTIPTDLYVPITCAKQAPHALTSLTQGDNQDCLIASLNASFALTIQDYIQIDIDAVNTNFAIDKNAYDMKTFASLQAYFDEIALSLGINDLFHYQDYINTNLNLKDLYDFYAVYTNDELELKYQFLSYVFIQKRMLYPLTTSFSTISL